MHHVHFYFGIVRQICIKDAAHGFTESHADANSYDAALTGIDRPGSSDGLFYPFKDCPGFIEKNCSAARETRTLLEFRSSS